MCKNRTEDNQMLEVTLVSVLQNYHIPNESNRPHSQASLSSLQSPGVLISLANKGTVKGGQG